MSAADMAIAGEACKLICAAVKDDGTDLEVLRALRSEKGVLRDCRKINCQKLLFLRKQLHQRLMMLPLPSG